jgi:hypothetical protein
MRTIIISDLHNRIYWIEDFLISFPYQYDRVIFLGDYFDDYNDTPNDAFIVAKWLKQSLKKPNRIHLNGTHDLWYRFPYNPFIEASGNTPYKEKVINSIITPSDWNKLKLFHYEQNFLISHAGLHIYLISDYVFKNKNIFNQYISNNQSIRLDTQQIIDKIIKPATDEALKDISNGHANSWLNAGFSRGGVQRAGGLIWLDWNEEFEPIPNINQIVGHTEHRKPEEKIIINSKNYDLDTRNHHIGLLEDGNFTWIENPYIR